MKRGVYLLLVILIIPIACANLGLDSSKMVIDVSIDSELRAIEKSSSARLTELQYQLTIYPQNTEQQTIINQEISPKPKSIDDTIIFEWTTFDDLVFTTSVDSRVEVSDYFPIIKEKIDFPLGEFDPSLNEYLVATENIDSDDPLIIELASDLAKGQDDLNYVVFELFRWVSQNVQYNMSTITATASQPASWVLENRYGVCDEITTLFMALSRSLGIPARYVSGVAYTNYLGIEGWEPHGWAELYFPEYGWIPFDVTYGEFGFVDASHVVFSNNPDSNRSTSFIMWVGRDVQMTSKQLNINASMVDRTQAQSSLLEFELRPLRQMVGFGSYNLINARIVNKNNFYVETDLSLSTSSGTQIISPYNKHVLLEPSSEKNIYWIIKVDKNLNSMYRYEMPFGIVSLRGTATYNAFDSSVTYPNYSLGEINKLLSDLVKQDSLAYSRNVNLNCSISQEEYYIYEEIIGSCKITNIGNVILQNLSICIDKCNTLELGIGRSSQINFTIQPENPGFIEQTITIKNSEITKTSNIKYTILDQPKLLINNITYPVNVSFDNEHEIVIHLTTNSTTLPQNG